MEKHMEIAIFQGLQLREWKNLTIRMLLGGAYGELKAGSIPSFSAIQI